MKIKLLLVILIIMSIIGICSNAMAINNGLATYHVKITNKTDTTKTIRWGKNQNFEFSESILIYYSDKEWNFKEKYLDIIDSKLDWEFGAFIELKKDESAYMIVENTYIKYDDKKFKDALLLQVRDRSKDSMNYDCWMADFHINYHVFYKYSPKFNITKNSSGHYTTSTWYTEDDGRTLSKKTSLLRCGNSDEYNRIKIEENIDTENI